MWGLWIIVVCVHQRGRRRPVAKSTTKENLHSMALTPLCLAPYVVHAGNRETGACVVDDAACLQEGDTLDCVVGHRRRQRETNPGRLRQKRSKFRAGSRASPSASHPSASWTSPSGLCRE